MSKDAGEFSKQAARLRRSGQDASSKGGDHKELSDHTCKNIKRLPIS